MVNVLLTSTPFEENPVYSHLEDNGGSYPLGLAYLQSYLKSKGHVVIIDWLNNHDLTWKEDLIQRMDAFQPRVIGFNVLTINRTTSFKGVELIHDKYPDTMIVLGGVHATIMYEQILRKYPYIVITRGEGEITFEDLLNKMDNLADVPGIAYNKDGMVIKNADRDLIEDLDILPFPDHNQFFTAGRTAGSILTARGCPGRCSFCCLNPLAKKRVRQRSVKNVINEVEYLVKTFPQMDTIWVQDDTFFLNNKRAIEFCNEIIKRNIKTHFCVIGRVKPISEELVMKLDAAGVKEVSFGMESGDDGILDRCHKGITTVDIEDAVRKFSKTNVNLNLYLIVGLPGETKETILRTAKFIQKLQRIKYMHFWSPNVIQVFPGTELYGMLCDAGKITDDYWLTENIVPYYDIENDKETINGFAELLYSYIKMENIFNLRGFLHQWHMIPWIAWYNVRYSSRKRRLRSDVK